MGHSFRNGSRSFYGVRAASGIPRDAAFVLHEQAMAEAGCAKTAEPPVIPIGLDAYGQWECWPYQRIGARTYMRSTYDRRGDNEGADASHFLYQESHWRRAARWKGR